MGLTVCPVAVIAAAVESAWELLSKPELRNKWWHAHTVRVVRDGKASPGQVIYLKKPVGRHGMLKVDAVDPEKYQIQWVLSRLGVTNDQTTTCTALDDASCRVQFG